MTSRSREPGRSFVTEWDELPAGDEGQKGLRVAGQGSNLALEIETKKS